MPCTLATVHMQDLAGDEAGILQIEDRVDDVVDLAETTDGMQFRQGVVGRRIVHRRADYPEGTAELAWSTRLEEMFTM